MIMTASRHIGGTLTAVRPHLVLLRLLDRHWRMVGGRAIAAVLSPTGQPSGGSSQNGGPSLRETSAPSTHGGGDVRLAHESDVASYGSDAGVHGKGAAPRPQQQLSGNRLPSVHHRGLKPTADASSESVERKASSSGELRDVEPVRRVPSSDRL
jgi:hypothetical protein